MIADYPFCGFCPQESSILADCKINLSIWDKKLKKTAPTLLREKVLWIINIQGSLNAWIPPSIITINEWM
jgi:hypothetical protein